MPYTNFILQIINLSLGGITAWTYFYRIDLWQDQAIFVFSAVGCMLNIFILLMLAIRILNGSPSKLLIRIIHLLITLPLLTGHTLCLVHVIWQKVI
ncbi:MAG: hypothetical protein HQK83_10145 [Fibrobacteria bacterium]|nr:hypothetical protein [Fibrobacteria bacterium]